MTEVQERARSDSERIGKSSYIGYYAVLGTWVTWFFWAGMMKGLAVLLPTLREQLQEKTWLIGWMIAIMDSTIDVTGPIAAPLGNHFGARFVVMISGLMVGAAFIISSYTSSVVVMTGVLALLAAPGVGMANIICREMIGRYYEEHCTTPFMVSQSGAALAFVMFAPLSQLLLDTYGWRGSLLLMGAIFLHLTVCGALLRFPSTDDMEVNGEGGLYSRLDTDSSTQEEGTSNQTIARETTFKSILKSVQKKLNTDLFVNTHYWLVALMYIFILLPYYAWFIYFVPHSQSKGFLPAEAVQFTMVFGVWKLFAGTVIGPLVDKYNIIGPNTLMGISILMVTLYYFIDPFLVSFWPNIANLAVYGCFMALTLSLVDVIMLEVMGVDQLGSAFGWMAMKGGILRFLLLFIPGLIYDRRGSYTLAYMLMGVIHVIPAGALLCLCWLQRKKK